MSVTDSKIIDALTLERENRKLVLRIFDHLSWSEDIVDTHLTALQEKINDYLDYMISKQYEEIYSAENYDRIVIKIVAKYPFNDEGVRCINIAKEVIENAGYYLEWEIAAEDA